jgi:hypothetical protein
MRVLFEELMANGETLPVLSPIIQPPQPELLGEMGTVAALPCEACGSPRQLFARFCTACGVPFETPKEKMSAPVVLDWQLPNAKPSHRFEADLELASGPNGSSFHCDSCGANVDVPPGKSSLRCPFCDSTYVVEIPKESRRTEPPEFVIGFTITREKALELFFRWLGRNSWFRPGDLQAKASTDRQQGIYLPFWHFSMVADSNWSAQIGEHWYRTETYVVKTSDGKTETRTRTVQETEWWPLFGEFRKYYSGYMVSASKGLPQAEALAIQPYQLSNMMRYRPHYLAGWLVEEYSISKEQALEITRAEFQRREHENITNFLPGDTQSGLDVSTKLDLGGTDLILLPVHVLSYRYRDKVFRFLVNGQTGKIYGEKPWSSSRITVAVIGVAILLVALIALVVLATHPRIGN